MGVFSSSVLLMLDVSGGEKLLTSSVPNGRGSRSSTRLKSRPGVAAGRSTRLLLPKHSDNYE